MNFDDENDDDDADDNDDDDDDDDDDGDDDCDDDSDDDEAPPPAASTQPQYHLAKPAPSLALELLVILILRQARLLRAQLMEPAITLGRAWYQRPTQQQILKPRVSLGYRRIFRSRNECQARAESRTPLAGGAVYRDLPPSL